MVFGAEVAAHEKNSGRRERVKKVNTFTPVADLPISRPAEITAFMDAAGHTNQLLAGNLELASMFGGTEAIWRDRPRKHSSLRLDGGE